MLYKFKSKAAGDVIMLQPNAQRLLEILGKHTATEPSIKGILLPMHMEQALALLKTAIVQEEDLRKQALTLAQANHLPPPRYESIALRQRALPLMDMIRVCLKAEEPITWGV
jgi:hypothetical protein